MPVPRQPHPQGSWQRGIAPAQAPHNLLARRRGSEVGKFFRITMKPNYTYRPGIAQGNQGRWGAKGKGAESAPTQSWRRVDVREEKHPENTTRRDSGGQGESTMNQRASELKDIALHTDNIGLWGPTRPDCTPAVYSVMVEAPAKYFLKGW